MRRGLLVLLVALAIGAAAPRAAAQSSPLDEERARYDAWVEQMGARLSAANEGFNSSHRQFLAASRAAEDLFDTRFRQLVALGEAASQNRSAEATAGLGLAATSLRQLGEAYDRWGEAHSRAWDALFSESERWEAGYQRLSIAGVEAYRSWFQSGLTAGAAGEDAFAAWLEAYWSGASPGPRYTVPSAFTPSTPAPTAFSFTPPPVSSGSLAFPSRALSRQPTEDDLEVRIQSVSAISGSFPSVQLRICNRATAWRATDITVYFAFYYDSLLPTLDSGMYSVSSLESDTCRTYPVPLIALQSWRRITADRVRWTWERE